MFHDLADRNEPDKGFEEREERRKPLQSFGREDQPEGPYTLIYDTGEEDQEWEYDPQKYV